MFLVAAGLYQLSFHYEINNNPIHAYFVNPDASKSHEFYLEVADSESERSKGLMFRKSLCEDCGMIFAFPTLKKHSFWMKDTYLSLDMIFLDEHRNVKAILENVPILSLEPREVEADSLYVVELAAGSAKQQNIKPGSHLVVSRNLKAIN